MNNNNLLTALYEWSGVFGRRTIHDFMAFAHENEISMAQISLLMRLYYRGPTSILLARQDLYGSRAAATQLVDKLVQMGLVERSEGIEDRRVKQIRLTEEGREMVQQGIAARRGWMKDLVSAFSSAEQEQLAGLLIRLSQAGRDQEERAERSSRVQEEA